MEKFTFLHSYSAYSILASGMSVIDYLNAVEKRGHSSAGLSDLNFLYGLPSFVKLAKQKKIKPLVGVDLVYQDLLLTFYPLNEDGYRNLIQLVRERELATLTDEKLRELSKNLLLIISTNQPIFRDNYKSNPKLVRDLFKRFALLVDAFYLGLEAYEINDDFVDYMREFATHYNYELVAFPHVKYVKRDDAINLELARAIKDNLLLGTLKTQTGPYYLYSLDELKLLYRENEMHNTQVIADKITFEFDQNRGTLLHFPLPKNHSNKSYLAWLCEQSFSHYNFDDHYRQRLIYELKVIDDMGYNDYFLIVADYVRYAKSVGILVGPGRGSAAGSLVAFLLGITSIDPLKYDLLFERFLNPARQTMPDIDIDFMDTRRDEVVAYLKDKYGADRIANIVTFQTNAARASIRDIGRIYEIEQKHINLLTKSLGVSTLDLRDSYRSIHAFKGLVDSDKFYLDIISLASKIEGFPRQTGMHAAGIILNNEPLINCLPIFTNNQINLSQYEMEYLEKQGFLKMDILGLTNLSTIETCLNLIKKNYGIDIQYDDLPFDDPRVYSLIASEQTMGIFQLESAGMLRAIRQIKPSEFADIVAVLALFRPGPMENIPLYAARKAKGDDNLFLDQGFKEILSSTYGIIVYQEQIMQIVRHMAGFSYAEADLFRRAISKKDEKQLIKLEKDFMNGALKKGYKSNDAKRIFDDIHKFADYGFNKSHSVAYAKLACQMAYLKAYYPLEFYAAILDKTTSSDQKYPQIVSEIQARGLKLLLPSINESEQTFTPSGQQLRLPLNMIKGFSHDKALRFIREREKNGKYLSLENFLTRANFIDVTKNDIRLLIEAGALDEFNHSRATMLRQLENLDYYKNYSFDGEQSFLTPIVIDEIDDNFKVKISREIELIGLALSDNPLKYVNRQITANQLTNIAHINQANPRIYGYVKAIKSIKTKKGDQMAFLTLSDYENEIEVTIFPNIYASYFDLLAVNKMIGVIGQYQIREDKAQILANVILNLEDQL